MNDGVNLKNIEIAVLSSMMFELDEVVFEKLRPEMFYIPAHQGVFESMIELYKKDLPIDEEFLRKRLHKKEIGDDVLLEIMSANPITKVSAYCDMIIEEFTKRQIDSLVPEIKKALNEENKDSAAVLELITQKLGEIENLDTASNDIKLAGEWDEEFKKEPELELLPTGIAWIDNALKHVKKKPNGEEVVKKGFRLGNFIFISGKKETGKTYLATTIMENMAASGIKCGFFSMEFGTKHYLESIKQKYKHSDNQRRVAIFENVYVEHRVNDIVDIEKKIRKMAKKGVKFVFIDSQLRVKNGGFQGATKAEMLADNFSRIGLLAQKHEIVIMMVVQTSKADHDAEEISVKGCIDADHEASIWIHIKKKKDSEDREMVFAKNKQNFIRPIETVRFNPMTHEFKKVSKDDIPIEYKKGEEPVVTEYGSDNQDYEVHSSDKTLSQASLGGIEDILG